MPENNKEMTKQDKPTLRQRFIAQSKMTEEYKGLYFQSLGAVALIKDLISIEEGIPISEVRLDVEPEIDNSSLKEN